MDNEQVNKFHALQLFTDTFSAETVHLTNHAIGIYIRLLCFAWTKNSKPFKTTSAYRICQCKDNDCESQVDSVLEQKLIRQLVFMNVISNLIILHTLENWSKIAVKELLQTVADLSFFLRHLIFISII